MLPKEQEQFINIVYSKLLDNEGRGWGPLDEYIVYLDYLEDGELLREISVSLDKHTGKKVHCGISDHDEANCLVPRLLRCAELIVDEYSYNDNVATEHRYILECYLAMDHEGFVRTIEKTKK